MCHIVYKNVKSERLKRIFEKVHADFPQLKGHKIVFKKRKVKGATMMARPWFDRHIFNKKTRSYVIICSENTIVGKGIKVNTLPEEVLEGWFAHEFGHLLDYLQRSFTEMIKFGIGYQLFGHFKVGAERQADLFAIREGYGEQIMATKNYILYKSDLPDNYIQRITKFYLSPNEVEALCCTESSAYAEV